MIKRIWLISDTHGKHDALHVPSGIDIVIHAGDSTNYRAPAMNEPEANRFFEWYSKLYIPVKIYVGGNHDTSMEAGMIDIPKNIIVLHNELTVIDGIKIYGSPYSPRFGRWAYMLERKSPQMITNWDQIPDQVDILITHSPPYGVLDDIGWKRVGCEVLAERLRDIDVGVHVFGHIHEQAGQLLKGKYDPTLYVNAAVVTFDYDYVNNGVVINYEYYNEEA